MVYIASTKRTIYKVGHNVGHNKYVNDTIYYLCRCSRIHVGLHRQWKNDYDIYIVYKYNLYKIDTINICNK